MNTALYTIYNTPAKWGVQDCCLAAANYYLETTGQDYAKEFRGKYDSAYTAYRLLAKAGGMIKILEKAGFREIPVTQGKTGDIALKYIEKKGYAMGIVNRSKIVCAGGTEYDLLSVQHIFRKG